MYDYWVVVTCSTFVIVLSIFEMLSARLLGWTGWFTQREDVPAWRRVRRGSWGMYVLLVFSTLTLSMTLIRGPHP
jgi:hypothetical protein